METIVDVEHDPVPLVLIMANVLRRNESDPRRARLLAHTTGRVVFRPASDPQGLTIEFRSGRVMVTRGAAPDADMTILADLATMSEEKPPKPAVSGALSHLRLALAVSHTTGGDATAVATTGWELTRYFEVAVRRNMPTLCICRGVQVLNVAMGGTLVQHVDEHMRIDLYDRDVHDVQVTPGSRLASLLGSSAPRRSP